MKNNDRPTYVNFTLVRLTAVIHAVLGSIILVLSGVILFALPAYVFWACFLFGFYLFVPGVVISFGLVNKTTAKAWSKWLIPLWKLIR